MIVEVEGGLGRPTNCQLYIVVRDDNRIPSVIPESNGIGDGISTVSTPENNPLRTPDTHGQKENNKNSSLYS